MAGIDPVLAEALGEIGKLSGLLKAHIEEVKRDRLREQGERAEDRLERQAMRADIRACRRGRQNAGGGNATGGSRAKDQPVRIHSPQAHGCRCRDLGRPVFRLASYGRRLADDQRRDVQKLGRLVD
jgi:hypothetical protein